MKRAIVMVAAMAWAASASAQHGVLRYGGDLDLEPLIGENLTKAFSGHTMDGTYKNFRQRSGTQNFTETFNADGTTHYREGDVTDKGEWRLIDEDKICFRYNGPLSGGVSCFVVFRDGNCLYSFNPRQILNGWPIDTNQWSAKTVIRGELSTCDDLIG